MICIVMSSTLNGIDGYAVNVEVDISDGLPAFDLVGLPDLAVRESKERVKSAIRNSDYFFPVKRITVNLAPADIKKEGALFDLPIAVGILSCTGIIDMLKLNDTLIIGELSLDGSVKAVNGVLPMVYSAYQRGIKRCIVPYANLDEGSIVDGIEIIGVESVKDVVNYFSDNSIAKTKNLDIETMLTYEDYNGGLDFSDVRGQQNIKRALEVAAAGLHNTIMIGPPGSGKTMMAKRIPSILPPLTFEESIEITKIYSVAGLLKSKNSLVKSRPFRSPHHTISASALTGGGRMPKPGEISLAHNGVLFLDELAEFPKNVLEVMRQPIENMEVTISRVNGTVTYPANFMLVASLNPCPCGYYPDTQRCHCSSNEIKRYLGKISGPLLDRIDINLEIYPVAYEDLNSESDSETSESIRNRVINAQNIQHERYADEKIVFNSQLSPSQIDKFCKLGQAQKEILKMAFERLNLSARAYHRILKVARTIADLDSSENIQTNHIAEAIQYRSRNYWI